MIPFLVYTAAAVVFTWPLVLNLTSHLAAPVGPGDPYLNLWILGWGMNRIVSDPASLLTGRVFNANIFHPADGTLAFSDHLLVQSLALSPLYALTGDVVLCYNVLLLVSLAVSGLAMHAFVRSVTGSTAGAYLAGLAWAFWPYRFAHLLHLQLQALYFLPLTFLFLHRLAAGRRMRDALLLGVITALQALSSIYYAVIGSLALVFGAVVLTVQVGRRAAIARRLALAAAVSAALVLPVSLVYWRVQQNEGFGRNLYEASRNAAQVSSYVQVPPGNVVYGTTELLRSGGQERELFPGVMIVALALVGLYRGWRSDARPLVVAMLAIGALGFVLSLGPDGIRPLYAFFHRYVFGFQAIRAPARFGVLVMFALATLAALGWRDLGAWPPARTDRGGRPPAGTGSRPRPYLVVLVLVAAIEFLNVPIPLTPAPPRQTEIGQWLRREPGRGPVIHLPLGLDVESTPAMVQSLEHERPLVNGYSGQRPAFYAPLVDAASTFPSEESLLALQEVGVSFLVSREPIAAPSGVPWPLVERARFADGVIYEWRWTPEMEQRLVAAVAIVPPPPGPAPFAEGETATYIVKWSGAAMNVAAGEITVAVQKPAYTFMVRAVTAPWVARFFEARDVFVTRADPGLLPQVHQRDQNEGSRHVTRAFLYDHARGVVRLGRTPEHAASEEGVSLPLPAASRDAISALFYARTLPLAPGATFRIPVNEAGRNLIVELAVRAVETIDVNGRSMEALRLEPRLRRRVERRQPPAATLWVSPDGRRLPLALDLEAGFGKLRVELVNYQQ